MVYFYRQFVFYHLLLLILLQIISSSLGQNLKNTPNRKDSKKNSTLINSKETPQGDALSKLKNNLNNNNNNNNKKLDTTTATTTTITTTERIQEIIQTSIETTSQTKSSEDEFFNDISNKTIDNIINENNTRHGLNVSENSNFSVTITPNLYINYENKSDNDSSIMFNSVTPRSVSNNRDNVSGINFISNNITKTTTNQPINESNELNKATPPNDTSHYDVTRIMTESTLRGFEKENREISNRDKPSHQADGLFTTHSQLEYITTHNPSEFISTTNSINNNDRFNFDFDNEQPLSQCILDGDMSCNNNNQMLCYGFGEIDCGDNNVKEQDHNENDNKKRLIRSLSINQSQLESKLEDFKPISGTFKMALESISPSETIEPSTCPMTPYVRCYPTPMLKDCQGKAVCKPVSGEIHSPMQFWKVGLVAGLAAAGGIIFIIAVVVGYLSWNKLKVRPELTINGYQNTSESTRV